MASCITKNSNEMGNSVLITQGRKYANLACYTTTQYVKSVKHHERWSISNFAILSIFCIYFVFLYMKLQQGFAWHCTATVLWQLHGVHGYLRVSFRPFVAKTLQQSNCQDNVKALIRPPGIFLRNFLWRTISGSARCCIANLAQRSVLKLPSSAYFDSVWRQTVDCFQRNSNIESHRKNSS